MDKEPATAVASFAAALCSAGVNAVTVLECCDPGRLGDSPKVLQLRPMTMLPNALAPEIVICQKADCRWLIADQLGLRTLDEHTEVRLDGRLWRLRETVEQRPTFRFLVSQDEEHVRLEIGLHGSHVDLGERVHHQSLLLLARERRSDELRGFTASECGWRDVAMLESMLGIDAQHFNTHLLRARRQVARALRGDAIQLEFVERRRGQARFGSGPYEVVGGACATG